MTVDMRILARVDACRAHLLEKALAERCTLHLLTSTQAVLDGAVSRNYDALVLDAGDPGILEFAWGPQRESRRTNAAKRPTSGHPC
jgi:hypothetical protein